MVPEFPMVVPVLDALDGARCPADIEPGPLPVVRHLNAVEPSGDAAIDAVLDEFRLLAPDLPWRQTVGYLDVLSQDYLDNYGYVQLLGPNSIVEHPTVRVGIGLWGPRLHYPAHKHEAEELYHVLAGEPSFGGRDGESRATRPGDAVYHAPWQEHCQDFGATPTVLLYCWTGAVEPDAVLVDVRRLLPRVQDAGSVSFSRGRSGTGPRRGRGSG